MTEGNRKEKFDVDQLLHPARQLGHYPQIMNTGLPIQVERTLASRVARWDERRVRYFYFLTLLPAMPF